MVYGPIDSGKDCVCPVCWHEVEAGISTTGEEIFLSVEDNVAIFDDEDPRSADLLHIDGLPVLACQNGHRFTHRDVTYVD